MRIGHEGPTLFDYWPDTSKPSSPSIYRVCTILLQVQDHVASNRTKIYSTVR